MPRTRVKICGITSLEDAQLAVELGADALGFNRIPASPRYLDLERLVAISRSFPFVSKVVLLVDAIEADSGKYEQFDYVQHYTDAALGNLSHSKLTHHLRVFRVRDKESLQEMANYPFRHIVGGYVLDAYHKDKLGGSGERFDWSLAVKAKALMPDVKIILAGGLTPENVGDAIRQVRPYAVDVSSGVEVEIGRKDPARMAAFFAAVRRADNEESI